MSNNFQIATGSPSTKSACFPWRDLPHHTIKTAASLLGCSPGKVYAELHAGNLSAVKLAGRTLITTDSLLAMLAKAQPWRPDPTISARVSAMRKTETAARKQSIRK